MAGARVPGTVRRPMSQRQRLQKHHRISSAWTPRPRTELEQLLAERLTDTAQQRDRPVHPAR
jgi:Spy/CpxP family protein refolding chaperone